MNHIIVRGRGIIFSLDFSISFLLMLVVLLVFAVFTLSFQSRRASELSDYRERKNQVLFLDSILKRSIDGNQLGIALFDYSKRRVMENRIGKPLIRDESMLREFGLVELWVECKKKNKAIYQNKSSGKECWVFSRMVFKEKDKCLLYARFCGE